MATQQQITTIKNPAYIKIMLVIAGIVGLASSFILLIEKLELAKNPNHHTSCDLSPFVSCGSVMASWQSTLFGFPNQMIGLIAFSVVIVMSVLALANVILPRWFWLSFLVGTTLGMTFIVWLWSQSLYSIGALCIYCMCVWSIMIPLFILLTRYVGSQGYLGSMGHKLSLFLDSWWWVILVSVYIALIASIFMRFHFYWIPLIESLFN